VAMRNRIRFFTLAVKATVNLLCAGAFLVVLGFFDQYLGWDIFSPGMEHALYGVFGSSVALGVFGLAISLVLGIQEMVQSLHSRTQREQEELEEERGGPVARRRYVLILAAGFVGLVLLVWALNAWNHHVLEGRQRVFKRLAREQMQALDGQFRREIEGAGAPCPTCAPATLYDLVKTFQGLSFCRTLEIYRPDPGNKAALWHYPQYAQTGGWQFERLFIARDVERAVAQALRGDAAWIDQMNRDANWIWYQPIRSKAGTIAVVKIEARPEESFRDYRASAETQPSTQDE
jgi:hypothetical protein